MDDIPKIGITGMPSVGKTQTLKKIIEFLENDGYKIEGMITEPIIEKDTRIGFYVIDWQTNEKEISTNFVKKIPDISIKNGCKILDGGVDVQILAYNVP